jgi:holo-[acyl-carrier protein] synthase
MSLAGIGVDMLEIARMQRVMDRRPSFLRRVFTDGERAYCERTARPAEHYAGRFGLSDVSVGHDETTGRPVAILSGRAAEVAREQGVREIALSLSFTRDVAVANAVAVTDEVRPQPDAHEDAARALAASFREARSVIDELERVQEQEIGTMTVPEDTAERSAEE